MAWPLATYFQIWDEVSTFDRIFSIALVRALVLRRHLLLRIKLINFLYRCRGALRLELAERSRRLLRRRHFRVGGGIGVDILGAVVRLLVPIFGDICCSIFRTAFGSKRDS